MAQHLWDGTETLFTPVRFSRSPTRAGIARLAEQHLESASLRHDGPIATIGHYPEFEDLPAADSAACEDDIGESSAPQGQRDAGGLASAIALQWSTSPADPGPSFIPKC